MNTGKTVTVTPNMSVGRSHPLLLIAGPCQVESLEHSLHIAQFLKELCAQFPVNLVFKASYDKANRTSVSSTRGPGVEKGLEILAQVKQRTGVPVLTDVHTPEQAEATAKVIDILQTPAFLCRQTDLLLAVGKTNKPVNIKKGQFLHPADMRFAAQKVSASGNHNILLCERGTSFGYRDLVVDMRSLLIMRELGYPVVFDATHSVQEMGSSGGTVGASGGSRTYVIPLARAAAATGIDGLFVECHDNPDKAPSDGLSMLHLNDMRELLDSVCAIRNALNQRT